MLPQIGRYKLFLCSDCLPPRAPPTQIEASGDVGTLFHLLGTMGLICWRDMNLHGDITEEAMREVPPAPLFFCCLPTLAYACIDHDLQLHSKTWRTMACGCTHTRMWQGVRDSDVFLLFLTNCVLSREFCQKEIGWALEFQKPIIMMVETEEVSVWMDGYPTLACILLALGVFIFRMYVAYHSDGHLLSAAVLALEPATLEDGHMHPD